MKVKEAMMKDIKFAPSGMNLKEAAQLMAGLDCGFLPVANAENDRLLGVVTDRDIVIRGVANGFDPNMTPVEKILTEKVLYCYADDDVEDAARSMRDQHVYRLIVLNNNEGKRLCGIISLGDIVRRNKLGIAAEAAKGITNKAA